MNLHRNAALSWQGRRRLARRVVEQGWTLASAAEAAGVSVRCARKWASRYRLEGEPGLHDRSSAPRRVANRTGPERVEASESAAASSSIPTRSTPMLRATCAALSVGSTCT